MPMTRNECEQVISAMTPPEEAQFLSSLGHLLTVAARSAYEFQAPGLKDPSALRAFNELHHRLYAQIFHLISKGQRNVSVEDITSWLLGEGHPSEFQAGCLWAFEQALYHARSGA